MSSLRLLTSLRGLPLPGLCGGLSSSESCSRALSFAALSIGAPNQSFSSEAAAAASEDAPAASEKVMKLADEITALTLLETADLTELLKDRLGVELPAGGFAMGAMPMAMPAAGAAPAAADDAPAEEAAPAKTDFDVQLDAFDAGQKIKLIKEVRTATDLGLKEAKELVESAPCVVKKGLPKEQAEELQKKLIELGAQVSLV
ncbi:ribosomal protein L7/L12 [Pseudoscourfieldia marina]